MAHQTRTVPLQRDRRAVSSVVVVALLALLACAPWAGSQATKEAQKADLIQPGDRLHIHATSTLPDLPIQGVFRVEPSGQVALGPVYGRVQIKGLTLEQAETVIGRRLGEIVRNAAVCVTRYDPLPRGHDLERQEALERRVRRLEKELAELKKK
jgi:protein involved in polysaccharide export with SLBB domain